MREPESSGAASLRGGHDGALTQALAQAFAAENAGEWKRMMLEQGVPLMAVNTVAAERIIGDLGVEHGWVTRVKSPIVGDYPRPPTIASVPEREKPGKSWECLPGAGSWLTLWTCETSPVLTADRTLGREMHDDHRAS